MNTHQDKKTAIGFNLGQRGDLILNTCPLRAFKEIYPDSVFTFAFGPQYADMVPLFLNQRNIENIHIFNSYDGWPNQIDKNYLINSKYDIIFNCMPQHTSNDWWKYYHQAQETILMHGIPDNKNYKCSLDRYFDVDRKTRCVGFAPFAGFYDKKNNKRLSQYKAQKVADIFRDHGYKVVHLGGPDEPHLLHTIKLDLSYFESVKYMLGLDALISTDTGMRWVSSAYDFPTVGLDSNQYYGDRIQAIQPINPNAVYLDAFNCNEIDEEMIFEKFQLVKRS